MGDVFFLFLYLITSVVFVVIQGMCFVYAVKFNTSLFAVVYVVSAMILGGTQFHILKYGTFPYGLLSNLNVYLNDDWIMYISTFFVWIHGMILPLFFNILTQPKKTWKE